MIKHSELLRLRKISVERFTLYKKQFDIISYLRLVDFIFLLISIVLFFVHNDFVWLLMTGIFSVIFLVLLYLCDRIRAQKKYYLNRMYVIDDYISRLNGEWIGRLKETGNEYNINNDVMLEDLNVVGEASLFSYLNVAASTGGKKRLFEKLSNRSIDDESLRLNQESIVELSDKVDFSLDFQAKIKSINQTVNLEHVTKSYQNTKVTYSHFVVGLLASITFVVLFIYYLLGEINSNYLTIPMLFQISNLVLFHYTNDSLLSTIQKTIVSIGTLYDVFSIKQDETYNSSKLIDINSKIKKSLSGLKSIAKLEGWDTLRNNILTLIIANAIFPFSLFIIMLYDRNIKKYSNIIEEGIASFEEFEALLSLSIIGQVKENVCIPKRTNEITIQFKHIQHPLLTEKQAVSNDFITPQGVNIITGSNMSGKTSFMKTIGINLVLMNAGTFVNANQFSAAYFKIFTSMRITDDITHGISTFYAELLRIKEAIDYQKENANMLTLIDEVFKGTNSNDRINGAISLINKLNTPKSIVIITTHDFELCGIKISNLFNYNFSEYYEGNEIKFSYKINKGECKTTNAKFLMRLVGIMDDNKNEH